MRRLCRYVEARCQLFNKLTQEYVTVENITVPYFLDPMEARPYVEAQYPEHVAISITPTSLPGQAYITMSNEKYLLNGTLEIRRER